MILQPTIFSPIIQYVALVNAEEILFEVEDNYQKQTYRNRFVIFGANGKQVLTIPVIHSGKRNKLKTKDIRIDYSTDWQKLHIRSLQSAYRSSPFFEFYEDDILPVFNKKYKYLLDLNFDSIQTISEFLQIEFHFQNTDSYVVIIDEEKDFRNLANAKSDQKYDFQKYTQVFDAKYGFIPNLSILDLIFNEGPNALMYLEGHKKMLF